MKKTPLTVWLAVAVLSLVCASTVNAQVNTISNTPPCLPDDATTLALLGGAVTALQAIRRKLNR
jgi:hypothetical protein